MYPIRLILALVIMFGSASMDKEIVNDENIVDSIQQEERIETTEEQTPEIKIEPIEATAIYTANAISINIGETAQLPTIFEPENVSNKTVKWYSSNPNIANVNENGLVSGVSEGSTVINLETINGLKTGCTVTVSKPLPIGEPIENKFCYKQNSVNGITVIWQAPNNSGKTINYYTVRVHFENAVGDPAFDELTGLCYRDYKVVGPVTPNQPLAIGSLVGYVPACSKIVITDITLQYSDGTEEKFFYGHSTTKQL